MKAVLVIGAIAMVGGFPSASASPAQVQLIAYERWVGDGSPDYEIWLMQPDGSRQRKLADGCCFDWSPDGRAIAFVTDDGSLSTINVDGTDMRRLVDGGADRTTPAWSPDGKRIAYDGTKGLFAVSARGGDSTRLTQGVDRSPDWSPNGRKIVFERFIFRPNENGEAIFVVNADGSGVHALTRPGKREPIWSPGGKKIAYLGWDDDANQDGLYLMNPDGSGGTLLVRPGDGDHDWSPGGGRIVFLSDDAIHTIRPDGRRHKRIVRGHNREPRWSPDGRRIVYRHRSRNHYEIYVVDASGKNVTNLTNTARPVLEDSPAWSPARG